MNRVACTKSISEINKKLFQQCSDSSYNGYDPFDGLNSSLLKRLKLDDNAFVQLAWIQLHKRLVFNLRPFVGIPKKRNPKGIALVIAGLLEEYTATKNSEYLQEAISLGDWLLANTSCRTEWKYTCWGYHFPWKARAFYVPAGKPNLITTCFVARSLFKLAAVSGESKYLEAALDAGLFIGSLFRDKEGKNYFAYIPGESAFVHNANLWGAALTAQAANKLGDELLLEKATLAVEQSIKMQKPDGSWMYGERSHHQFIDSFHTGYNLEAIWWFQRYIDSARFQPNLHKGIEFYRNNFFLDDGTPKYYNNAVYPIDMHSVAQAVFTLLLVGGTERDRYLVDKIVSWSLDNMYLPQRGMFRYQKHRFINNNINYMRWTQAWMYYALTFYSGSQTRGFLLV